MPRPTTATQMPLVREPRSGSLPGGRGGGLVVVASLGSGGVPGPVGGSLGGLVEASSLMSLVYPSARGSVRRQRVQPAATSVTATAHRPRPIAWARCTGSRSTVAASMTVKAGYSEARTAVTVR